MDAVTVTGVTGQFKKQVFLQPLECQLGDQKFMHNFLYMLDCPIPLLGWNFLCKLHAQVTFSPKKQQLCVEVQLEHAIQVQALSTCPEGPGGKHFPSEIYEIHLGWWNPRWTSSSYDAKPGHCVRNPTVALQTTTTLNPATLLPDSEGDSVLPHDCLDQPWQHLTGSCIQMGAALWKMAKDKLS